MKIKEAIYLIMGLFGLGCFIYVIFSGGNIEKDWQVIIWIIGLGSFFYAMGLDKNNPDKDKRGRR